MWNSFGGDWTVIGGIGLFVAGGLAVVIARLVYLAAVRVIVRQVKAEQAAEARAVTAQREAADRQAELAAITPQLMRVNGELHTRAHWDAVAVAERLTGIMVEVVRDGEVLRTRTENALLLSDWIRDGGNPEANWTDIVKWKNSKGETK